MSGREHADSSPGGFDLAALVHLPPAVTPDLETFLREPPSTATVDFALSRGHAAPSLGLAFAAGYRAALAALVPSLAGEAAALCVTEDAGNLPKHVETKLERTDGAFALRGEKSFVTLGRLARILLVAAVTHVDDAGKRRLALVRVPSDRAGIAFTDLPTMPFVPEIPHARVTFAGVRVEEGEVLPGDGWDDYVKPFRTVEDLHVCAAVIGFTLGRGRAADAPTQLLERGLSLAAAARSLAGEKSNDAGLHLALAGLFAHVGLFVAEVTQRLEGTARQTFERDVRLLGVASGAREARTKKAWEIVLSG